MGRLCPNQGDQLHSALISCGHGLVQSEYSICCRWRHCVCMCVYVCVVCVQGGRVGCGGDVCEVMYECIKMIGNA